MNGALKTNLINDCLSDAVVDAGQHGDPIRAAMKLAVCRELGGTPVAGQPCDFTGAELDRPIAVITESLGSKILFDAARATYEEVGQAAGARAAMTQRFASVQMIYLMANQIPLLDIASPLPTQLEADAQEGGAPHSSSLGHMIGVMHGARTAMPSERLAAMATPTVVAFTDPNDLLSYRLIPSVLERRACAADKRDRIERDDMVRLPRTAGYGALRVYMEPDRDRPDRARPRGGTAIAGGAYRQSAPVFLGLAMRSCATSSANPAQIK